MHRASSRWLRQPSPLNVSVNEREGEREGKRESARAREREREADRQTEAETRTPTELFAPKVETPKCWNIAWPWVNCEIKWW